MNKTTYPTLTEAFADARSKGWTIDLVEGEGYFARSGAYVNKLVVGTGVLDLDRYKWVIVS